MTTRFTDCGGGGLCTQHGSMCDGCIERADPVWPSPLRRHSRRGRRRSREREQAHDLSRCPYYRRGEPGADPEGICGFGCADEPVCKTSGPWPLEERRRRQAERRAAARRAAMPAVSTVVDVKAATSDLAGLALPTLVFAFRRDDGTPIAGPVALPLDERRMIAFGRLVDKTITSALRAARQANGRR